MRLEASKTSHLNWGDGSENCENVLARLNLGPI